MRVRSTLVAFLLLCGAWSSDPLLTAQEPGPDQRPAFRSGVELVTVDVGVTDKQGHPVRGLGAADFAVTVAGQPRRVVTAEFIDVEQTRAVSAAPPDVVPISTNEGGGTGRLFLFVVDNNTLDAGDARHVAAAAARVFSRFTFADRSALVSLPTGQTIAFTFAHERVRDALLRSTGLGIPTTSWEYGSLSEARDIVTRGDFALREIGTRECGSSMRAADGFGDSPGTAIAGSGQPAPATGGTSGGSGQGSQSGTSGTQPPRTAPSLGPSTGDVVADRCLRELQSSAEMTWSMARSNSLSSLTALRGVLAALGRVRGEKTVFLISGGWPMDEREQTSDVSAVASAAAAAGATIYTFFVPHSEMSVTRSRLASTPGHDRFLYSWALDNLAAMTGGRSYTADIAAEGIFDRLARELGGYYRIAVERNAIDTTASGQRMKVQVSRSGVSVNARQVFDVATYEDRDWSARLASALDSPAPATGLALRLTSYLAPDPDDPAHLRIILAGDASRVQPGAANLQLVVRDLEGRRIVNGEQRLGEPSGSTIPFATNVRVPPGSYLIRLAVMDGAGRVGSVDRRVEARPVSLGTVAVTGPMLVQVPPGGRAATHFALDGVRHDERLGVEIGLEGDAAKLADAQVTLEVAATAEGPALIQQPATLSHARGGDGSLVAEAIADVRVLPPGQYFARVKINSGTEPIGEVRRTFTMLAHAADAVETGSGESAVGSATALSGISIRGRAFAAVPAFGVDRVLAPQVLDGFLARVRARPDASLPAAAELLNRVRPGDIAALEVSDAEAVQSPIAAFVRGLTLLARNKLDPAAIAFRSAMRASPDFYPAMVYLGACYAAGGKDKDAAAVWRTALIKEGNTPALHLLLSDALLRQGIADVALQTIAAARARWPEDDQLKQRFVIAALAAGNYAEALPVVDDLVARGVEDEPSHALALLVLYDSLTHGHPIEGAEQDRARMMRLADAYRARGGPSRALVDTWVAAVNSGDARHQK